MSKINKTVKHALDRFLANVEAGNDTQVLLLMKKSEKEVASSRSLFFAGFDSKSPNPAIEMIEEARRAKPANDKGYIGVDRSTLIDALEEYLDKANRTVKAKFISQILQYYDLDTKEFKAEIVVPSVNYLRRQNFISELHTKDYERSVFGMRGLSF